MARNANLQKAKNEKNDEFYTLYEDIEKEMQYHTKQFEGKAIYCNCDDPTYSNFWKYFHQNFTKLKLKKLISTHYEKSGNPSYALIYDGGNDKDILSGKKIQLEGDGDFRSVESIYFLNESDIVVTNPPFSIFSDFIKMLIKRKKDFVVLGNKNAYTYKVIFPHIKSGKISIGLSKRTGGMWMRMPDGISYESKNIKRFKDMYLINVSGVRWFTTLKTSKQCEYIPLINHYNSMFYKKYTNYDAIEIGKTSDIPDDYYGVMGVPVSFFDRYNPEQFEIIGASESEGKGFSNGLWNGKISVKPVLNGKKLYKRIFIKQRCNHE